MNTNEESNKEKAITTLEIENTEDELKQLNENSSNTNHSSQNKKVKKYSIFTIHDCRKVILIILLSKSSTYLFSISSRRDALYLFIIVTF